MSREMEKKRGERQAPPGQAEPHSPDRDRINTSSVRETLSKNRTHDRRVDPRSGLLPEERQRLAGNTDARWKFTKRRADDPAKETKPENSTDQQPEEAADGTPVLGDIARSRDSREPAAQAKRRYHLNFKQEEAQSQPATRSGKAVARYRAANAEAGQTQDNQTKKHSAGSKTASGAHQKSQPPQPDAQERLVQKKKAKRRLLFEEEGGPKKPNTKGLPAARPVKAAAGAAMHQAHRKVSESEQENVGVEAAHKGEQMAEGGVRAATRLRKAAPRQKTGRLKQKETRLQSKTPYTKAKPAAQKAKKSAARMAQKRRQQRIYAKAARNAQRAARSAKKAGGAAKSTAGFIRRHPVAFLVVLLIALIVIVIVTLVSSFSGVASEAAGTVLATSYLAPDADIDAAELAYTEWETDLQIEINGAERTHPGYDEYRYTVDDIGHGPHELMAYLTAVYDDFSFANIEADLHTIFDAQYTLTYTEETETRTETRTIQAGESLGTVVTSGYCNCSLCNGQWAGGPTASGVMPRSNHTVAVDANNPFVPMGTRVIMGGVEYKVEDTGNFHRYGVDFDIYFDSHATATNWGHTRLEAYLADGNENTVEVTTTREVRILNVNLTAESFTDVIWPRMNDEQKERYNLLARVKGNRQYAGSPCDFNWLHYVSDGYGWRVHPTSGGKDYHKGVDIAIATGTEIKAAHDGTVTFAGNSRDYGLAVFIAGEKGVETRYGYCSELLVSEGQAVVMGDTIAKVGSMGGGPGLHFEVLKDGQNLNPLYFAITNDDGSGYIPPGSPGGAAIPGYPGAPMDDARFAAMMEEAQKHLGKPYVFGASGPSSFDCSGFVSYVLSQSVYPGFGRTTAQGLYNICTPVSRTDAQPGDLIFFTGTYNAGRPVTHVGIFIGNGQMVHAGKPVGYASIDTPYWTSHLYAFGRLPV
jgi:murein DD-endopeptidase MepM/ murein hydrolase activator NlpD/3D (Asp-Asp-Asp) domain-containing protein